VLSGSPWHDPVRLCEHAHGHLGWLAAAALVHPAVLLRRSHRRAAWAVLLAAIAVTLAGAGGVLLYPRYRTEVKGPIFATAPAIGFMFERKEHLAFGAVFFAWAGVAAYFGAGAIEGDVQRSLRRAAHWSFVAAATLAVSAACLGTLVAAYRTFGDG
jgi:hypothetical protein